MFSIYFVNILLLELFLFSLLHLRVTTLVPTRQRPARTGLREK